MDIWKISLLAEALYQESNTTAVPWSQRNRTVQETWLNAARRQIQTASGSVDTRHPVTHPGDRAV